MSVLLTDLYAVRPICSLCCCAFNPQLACMQLSCCHIFCQYCVQELAWGAGFVCPFDQTQSVGVRYDQQNIDSVECVLANPAAYAAPLLASGISSIFSVLQSTINFSLVPCRAYFQSGTCPYSQRYCPYNHTLNPLCGKGCPLGNNCYRGQNCPYGHQRAVSIPPNTNSGGRAGIAFHQFPKWFNSQPISGSLTITLSPTKRRYREIASLFAHNSPNRTILRIERVQNKALYTSFAYKHESASLIETKPLKISRLFHGSGSTPPPVLYNSPSGLDSHRTHGPWGFGCYYSRDSSYIAHQSAHRLQDGSFQVICCNVIVGEGVTLQPNSGITGPPARQGGNKVFHCVKGRDRGTEVVVTYEAGVAYPYFIITFT